MIRPLLLAALLAAAPATARDVKDVIMPTDARAKAVQEQYGYADAVIAGDTVYLSGIVVWSGPEDKDVEASFTRTFKRIEAILKRAGSSLDDVVDITSFHTDIEPQVDAMAKAKNRLMPGPPPAWTAIGATRLLAGQAFTEIKIVARRKAARAAG